MNKFTTRFLIIICLTVFLIHLPKNTFGAELSFKIVPNTNDDSTKTIEVRIDPESKRLNVIDGEILFSGTSSGDLKVQVENGQSILPIWPTPPQYSSDNKSIIFTGGIPNGFDSEGLLFRMRVSSNIIGDLEISYTGNAYLNDGKGTQVKISSDSIKFSVDKTEGDAKNVKSFDIIKYKYVIIILLIIVFGILIYKYVYKKE